MKKLLILGGTQFIGRRLVERLSKNKNLDITLFLRGKTNPNLFPNIRKILGDRETKDIQKITNQYWDYIIDVSCYHPNSLEKLIDNLKGKVGRYIFISTISVFPLAEFVNQMIDEKHRTLKCSTKQRNAKEFNGSNYGAKKAECERILLKAEWLDKIIFRPSIVYGVYDHLDRLYYWIYRIKTADRILIPNYGRERVTLTYVDDLVRLIEEGLSIKEHSVIYNTTTHNPKSLLSIWGYIEDYYQAHPNYTNISQTTADEYDIVAWQDLPLCSNFEGDDLLLFDNSRLKQDFKISLTPFQKSINQTLDYYEQRTWKEGKAGMNRRKEYAFLKKLRGE